ncbi:MAG: C69 family dipeptidase [Promethearchaeota archaeon]
MCDTLVALRNSTLDGSVIFGKNSDRPTSEAQLITYAPRTNYSKGAEVNCTYISIPQISETYAILLSQPFWMWGGEMGANEYGVVIGNEAIYTHEPLRRTGLLGMDLLRLGLERGKKAKESLNIIVELIEKYHQGGGCAYGDPSWLYHNSFIIADNEEAYVLETADDWWIAEKIKEVRSISNEISIRGKGDFRRKGIIEYAIEKGYCKDDNNFDFAITFSGNFISDKPSPYSRGGKSSILLNKNNGKITPKMMMQFLREHEAGICMHGGFESTGSQVSHLRKEKSIPIHWFTGTTLPCLSIYKPYIFPIKDQKILPPGPYSKVNPDWIWSQHTSFLRNYKGFFKKSEIENYIKNCRNYEDLIITKLNNLISKENEITLQEFSKKVIKLNHDTWDKTTEMMEN